MKLLDSPRWIGVAVALALHIVAALIVLSYAPAREALRVMAPVIVDIITPPAAAPPRVAPETPRPPPPQAPPPRPRAEVRPPPATPASPAPVLATEAPAAPAAAAPAPPRPAPEAPPAVASPPVAIAPPTAAPAPPPPVPITPPDFKADYLDNPAPAYPPLSRRMGEQGRVVLRVMVDASGLPSSVEIRTSSGSERLDQAALEAVKRWKFVPARQGERAVPAQVLVPISFNLKG